MKVQEAASVSKCPEVPEKEKDTAETEGPNAALQHELEQEQRYLEETAALGSKEVAWSKLGKWHWSEIEPLSFAQSFDIGSQFLDFNCLQPH